MTLPREIIFENKAELFSALSLSCQQLIQQALVARLKASIIVSGGSTPKPLYRALSTASLNWQRVTVALVDERWVDEAHRDSNALMINETLLQDKATAARFIAMKNSCDTAQAGCSEVEIAYSKIPAPFDLLILGMGPDGHIASLFPDAKGIDDALDLNKKKLCCAIQAIPSEVTGENTERMSLTLHGILQARKIILLITGEEKLQVYRSALSNTNYQHLPVSALLQQQHTPIDVYWAP